MIDIENIGKHGYAYQFPTIDFKFQNTGNATAFIWKFKIDILDIQVDKRPSLDFKYRVTNGKLEIICTNNSWGAVNRCNLILSNPALQEIFHPRDLRYSFNFERPGAKRVIKLKPSISKNKITKLSKKFLDKCILNEITRLKKRRHNRISFDLDNAIQIYPIQVSWNCLDYKSQEQFGKSQLTSYFKNGGSLWALKDKFITTPSGIHACSAGSHITYITIIEPDLGVLTKDYPISRKVPPGDVERFHIMIGGTKSCKLKVRFSFFADKDTVLESEIFSIHIWNPYNSQWHNYYDDGDELYRLFSNSSSEEGYHFFLEFINSLSLNIDDIW